MADIGTAYIKVAPNMSGIQGKIAAGVKGAGTSAGESLGSEIGNSASLKISSFSAVIAGATAALVSKGIDVASSALSNFVNSASELQSVRASFESLTGSVAATNDVMSQLYKYSFSTAFSNADIQNTAKSLLAAGVSIQDLSGYMNQLGDLAGATGASLTGLALPITQSIAKGKLQTQDWYQILNQGAGGLEKYIIMALGAGHSVKTFSDDLSNGAVTTKVLTDALALANSQGGMAFQGALKQSETFNGRLSNLGETITNVGLKILGVDSATGQVDSNGLFARFSNSVQSLIDALGSSNFQSLMTGLANGLTSVVNSLFGAVKFIVDNKDIFAPIAVGIGAVMASIAVGFARIKVLEQIQQFGKLTSAIRTGAIAFGELENMTGLAAKAQALYNVVSKANWIAILVTAIVALVAGLTYFFTQTKTGQAIWASFTAFMANSINGLRNVFSNVAGVISNAWSTSIGNIIRIIGDVQQIFQNLIDFFTGGDITLTGDHLSKPFIAWVTTLNNIRDNAINIMNTIVGWIEKNSTVLINVGIIIGTLLLPKIMSIGIEAGISAVKWVISMAQIVASAVVTGAQTLASFVVMGAGAVTNAAIATAAWVESSAKSVAAFVVGIPKMVTQFAVGSASAVSNAAITTGAWIASAAKTVAGWAVSFATMIAGFIATGVQAVIAAAKVAASWLLALGPIGLIIAAVAGVTALIIANWGAVSSFLISAIAVIQNAVGAVINWVINNWPLLLAIITGPIGLATLFIVDHFQQISNFVGGIVSTIGGFFSGLWNGIVSGVSGMFNSVVGFFSALPGRILGAIGGLGNLLYNSGRDMINGLISGSQSILKNIGSFFLNVLPSWIKEPFKKALGIHSPSKVFAGFGGNITQGLVNGINDGKSDITKAVNNISESTLSPITGVMGSANAAYSTIGTNASVNSTSNNNNSKTINIEQNNTINDNTVSTDKIIADLSWAVRRA